MPHAKLTKSLVDRAEPTDKDIFIWDKAQSGFGLRIKPSGVKSFVIQYRNRETGRSRRQTLGRYGPTLSLNAARERARQLLSQVVAGGDPVEDRQRTRSAPTMSELAELYMTEHAIPKKRPKSVANDRAMLNRHILPALGRHKVDEVTAREVQRLHNRLSNTPYQANRVLALLSKMFSLSIRWGMRSENPVMGIEKYSEEKRQRWLSEDELARLILVLDEHPNRVAANAIRLQLLTGARIGEVLNSEWDDFDLGRGVWTKPSHHTKQKRTEHLPLSSAAVELLELIKSERRNGPFVFPGRFGDQPYKDLKSFWRSVTKQANLDDYRIHDNRHTHASYLVSSGLSLPIIGRLLGHTNPSTTMRYAHLADDPLRQATEVMARKMNSGTVS